MADDDSEVQYQILPGAAVFGLIRRLHTMGIIRGHQTAYADATEVLSKQIQKLEVELIQRPRDAYLMGSIAALVQFADVLRRGHDAAGNEIDECRESLMAFCEDAGLESLLSAFMQTVRRS